MYVTIVVAVVSRYSPIGKQICNEPSSTNACIYIYIQAFVLEGSLHICLPIGEYRDTAATTIVTYVVAADYHNTETTSLP